ncbi:MAG: hypothetical protein U0M31_04700 [Oscillospiraceae bacterium]|nr:hypothetical protein [Oscillospiraceae bacterium]
MFIVNISTRRLNRYLAVSNNVDGERVVCSCQNHTVVLIIERVQNTQLRPVERKGVGGRVVADRAVVQHVGGVVAGDMDAVDPKVVLIHRPRADAEEQGKYRGEECEHQNLSFHDIPP